MLECGTYPKTVAISRLSGKTFCNESFRSSSGNEDQPYRSIVEPINLHRTNGGCRPCNTNVTEDELLVDALESLKLSSIDSQNSTGSITINSDVTADSDFNIAAENIPKSRTIPQPFHSTPVKRSNLYFMNGEAVRSKTDVSEGELLKDKKEPLKAFSIVGTGRNFASNLMASRKTINLDSNEDVGSISKLDKVTQHSHSAMVKPLNLHHGNDTTVIGSLDKKLLNAKKSVGKAKLGNDNNIAESNTSVSEDTSNSDSNVDAENSLRSDEEDSRNSNFTTEEETFTNSSSNSEVKTSSSKTFESLPNLRSQVSTSAWGQWLLEKEKKRRKILLTQLEQNQRKVEKEKKMIESKNLEKQKADEIFHKWLSAKKEDIKNRMKLERLSIFQKEKDAQIEKEKSCALIQAHLKNWHEKKRNERLLKRKSDLEAKANALKNCEERKQRSERAYEQWLQKHREPRRDLYSYGYSGGTIVCYYDATSPPPPTFCTPRPWIFPS